MDLMGRTLGYWFKVRIPRMSDDAQADNSEQVCPTCEGAGWVLGVGTESGHAEGCWGGPNCGSTCPVPVQVQIQEGCEDCQAIGKVKA